MNLSKHFSREEFECKCGCGTNTVDAELLGVLEFVRLAFGHPVKINSGHRCSEHNEKIGGAKNSMHLTGKAADIVVENTPAEEVYSFLDTHYHEKYGIGKYSGFTHIDVRENKARW